MTKRNWQTQNQYALPQIYNESKINTRLYLPTAKAEISGHEILIASYRGYVGGHYQPKPLSVDCFPIPTIHLKTKVIFLQH